MGICQWKVTEMQLYRLLAKGVAILDLVLSVISMMWVFALTVYTAATENKYFSGAFWVLCVLVGIYAIITALRMCTTIRLLSATQLGREPFGALRLASTWMTVSIVFLVLDIIGLVAGWDLSRYVFTIRLLPQGVMMCIVSRYMLLLNQEILERIITSIPVSVTEKESVPHQAFHHREAPLGLKSVTTTTRPCNCTEMNLI